MSFGGDGDLDQLAVDVGADEALLPHALEQLAKLPLPALNERRAHLDARVARPCEHDVGDLRGALSLHGASAIRAVRRARARPEQAQVVVDLRDRSDGGSRVVSGSLLLDGDGRRQPLDGVDVRLLHEPEKLARVGREGLDVPPLSFGVDGVEGQRGLAGAGQPGDHRQLIPRDRDVDVSEVVLAGAANDQRIFCHSQGKLRPGPIRDKPLYCGAMPHTDAIVVFTTVASDEEAVNFVRVAVGPPAHRLRNAVPGARSLYRWQGKVADEREVVVMLKTRSGRLDSLRTARSRSSIRTRCRNCWRFRWKPARRSTLNGSTARQRSH